jgi:ribosomal protein L7/L12
MECATCLRRYGDRNAKVVKAYHVATGVSLTLVPEFVDRRNPLTAAISQAEAYAKATLAAYPGELRRFKRLPNIPGETPRTQDHE